MKKITKSLHKHYVFLVFYCCCALKYHAAGNFLIGCRESLENGRGFWRRMCSWLLVRTCGNTVKSGSSSSAELDNLYPSIGELGLPSMTTATTTTATAGSGRVCSTATTTRPPLSFSYAGDGHLRPPWVEVVDLTADSPNPSLPSRLLLTPPGSVHFILRGTEVYIKEKMTLKVVVASNILRCFS